MVRPAQPTRRKRMLLPDPRWDPESAIEGVETPYYLPRVCHWHLGRKDASRTPRSRPKKISAIQINTIPIRVSLLNTNRKTHCIDSTFSAPVESGGLPLIVFFLIHTVWNVA